MTGPSVLALTMGITVGAIPVVWLHLAQHAGAELDRALWIVACGFFVSFLADLASLLPVDPVLVSAVYPVAQCGLIAFALLMHRSHAIAFLWVIAAATVEWLAWHYVAGQYDVVCRAIAAIGLCTFAWRVPRFWPSVVTYFGLGAVAWIVLVTWPGWPAYLLYQLTRAAGVGLFCWDSLAIAPRFKVMA